MVSYTQSVGGIVLVIPLLLQCSLDQLYFKDTSVAAVLAGSVVLQKR